MDVVVIAEEMVISSNCTDVYLTKKEFLLFESLVGHDELQRIVLKSDIFMAVWPERALVVSDSDLYQLLLRLRRKLKPFGDYIIFKPTGAGAYKAVLQKDVRIFWEKPNTIKKIKPRRKFITLLSGLLSDLLK